MKTPLPRLRIALYALISITSAYTAHATTFTVTNVAASGAGSLLQAIQDLNADGGAGPHEIVLNLDVPAPSGLPPVRPQADLTIRSDAGGTQRTIDGSGNSILFLDGNGGTRAVTIRDIKLTNGLAKGGDGGAPGGGGGLGAGGAIFVNDNINLTLDNFFADSSTAQGGAGGAGATGASGGGGGGALNSGDGGAGGATGLGGNPGTPNGGGGGGGDISGGTGDTTVNPPFEGGTGGDNATPPTSPTGTNFGGGGGGGLALDPNGSGADGSFGSGGGAGGSTTGTGTAGTGGDSPYGGGGGGGGSASGGGGALGAGGTDTSTTSLGGAGGSGSIVGDIGGGGGGGAAGGALFVRGVPVTIQGTSGVGGDTGGITGNTVTAGTGGALAGTGTAGADGTTSGDDIFLQDTAGLTYDIAGTYTMSGTIGGELNNVGITKTGAGVLDLTASTSNTYHGGFTFDNGTTQVAADGAFGDPSAPNQLNFAATGTGKLQATATFTSARQVNLAGAAEFLVDSGATLTLTNDLIGVFPITKDNPGILELTGTGNTFSGVTVTAGTLKGSVASLPTDITNNGAVIFDQAVNADYTNVVSGTGTLEKQGVGELTLSGLNTYGGDTTITAGTLKTAVANLPATTNIINNAALIFDQGIDATFANSISGTGTIDKQNTGKLTLTGTNTNSGLTTITDGTLQGSSTSLSSNILNNAALIFDQTVDGNYNKIISGTGTVEKIGAAELTLSGSNSYTGDTTITAGTLRGSTTSLPSNIVNNAALIFDQTSVGTFGNTITGTGTVEKQGTGTVILSAANSYTGDTTIEEGSLIVNGSITSNVLVNPSSNASPATLGGTGTITGDITNFDNGIIDAGNTGSVGTLTVTGNVVQSVGTAQFDLDGAPAVTSDLLDITGDLTFNGGTIKLNRVGGTLASGQTYTVASYTGTGTVDVSAFTIDSTGLGLFTGTVTHDAGSMEVQILIGSDKFSSVYKSGNLGLIATYIDTLNNDGLIPNNSQLATDLTAICAITDPEAKANALAQVSPSRIGNLSYAALNNYTQTTQILSNRLSHSRRFGHCGRTDKGKVWIQPHASYTNRDSEGEHFGYNVQNYGIAFGTETLLFPYLTTGIAGAYHYNCLRHGGFDTDNTSHNLLLMLYGSSQMGNLYFDGMFGLGYHDYSINRHIKYPGVNLRSKGNTEAYSFLVHLGGGYSIDIASFECEIFGNTDFSKIHVDDFTEIGAGSLSLAVESHYMQQVVLEGGGRISKIIETDGNILVPTAQVSARYYLPIGDNDINSGFTGLPKTLTVSTFDDSLFVLAPRASLRMLLPGETFFEVYGDAELNTDYQKYEGGFKIGVKY